MAQCIIAVVITESINFLSYMPALMNFFSVPNRALAPWMRIVLVETSRCIESYKCVSMCFCIVAVFDAKSAVPINRFETSIYRTSIRFLAIFTAAVQKENQHIIRSLCILATKAMRTALFAALDNYLSLVVVVVDGVDSKATRTPHKQRNESMQMCDVL